MQQVHGGKEHVLTWGGLTDATSTEVVKRNDFFPG